MRFLTLIGILLTTPTFAQSIMPSPLELKTQAIYEALANNDTRQGIKLSRAVEIDYKRRDQQDELATHYFAMALNLAFNGHYAHSIRYHKQAMRAHSRLYHQESTEILVNLGLTYLLSGKERKAKRILKGESFRW